VSVDGNRVIFVKCSNCQRLRNENPRTEFLCFESSEFEHGMLVGADRRCPGVGWFWGVDWRGQSGVEQLVLQGCVFAGENFNTCAALCFI